MNKIIIFFFVAFVELYICAKLPSQFQKCNRKQNDFDDCLVKSIEDALRNLKEPIKEYGLPSLHPLKIPALTIAPGSGPAAVEQVYKNMTLSGFETVTCSKASVDFEKKKMNTFCKFPNFRLDFIYEFNGHIMMLPIKGTGPGSYQMKELKYDLSFDFEEYSKKNLKYFKVVKSNLAMSPELIIFDFKNLFGGNKAMADSLLGLINENENWKALYQDVQSSYEDAFGQISTSIFNKLLAKVPINEMFGDE